LREPNLGKTNPRVSLHYSLAICFAPSLVDSIIFLTLTRLVVVFIFVNFSFALFTPPLGDFQLQAFARERERVSLFVSSFPRATLSHEGPGPPFYRCKKRVQMYNGGVARR
jgi:hypothetical protein